MIGGTQTNTQNHCLLPKQNNFLQTSSKVRRGSHQPQLGSPELDGHTEIQEQKPLLETELQTQKAEKGGKLIRALYLEIEAQGRPKN